METRTERRATTPGQDDVFENFAGEFIRSHPVEARPVERIVVATDFSLCSLRAVSYAATLATRLHAELVLVYAQGGPDRVHPTAEAHLLRTAARLREDGLRVRSLLRPGAADEEILDAAKREGASLIVMGTHGRSGLERVVLGSIAERVLRKAPCPVLTIGLHAGAERARPAR